MTTQAPTDLHDEVLAAVAQAGPDGITVPELLVTLSAHGITADRLDVDHILLTAPAEQADRLVRRRGGHHVWTVA